MSSLPWPPVPVGWPDGQVAQPEGERPEISLATAVAERAQTLTTAELMAIVPDVLQRAAGRLPDDDHAEDAMPVIRSACRSWADDRARQSGQVTDPRDVEAVAQAVYDVRYDMGPLTPYLRDPHVENVDINGCDQVWVTYATGERAAVAPIAPSDEALVTMIRTWANRGGQTARDFSAASPLVNVAMAMGARLTATMAVTPRPCVSVRRHGQVDITLARLIELGTIDPALAAFLAAAVKGRCNIIVTGGVNAGKTTMLRALASEIPAEERIATLETEYELFLHTRPEHPDVIAFEAREANSEGVGSITLHDMIAHALRHNPRRILVGEVRRTEIMPMLEAMNSGQEGSMCTLHSNSPTEAFDRILILGLRGGLALAERAIHILVGMAVDLIVHVRRGYDGRRTVRYVSEVLEVLPPGDTERPAVNRLFLPHPATGRAIAAHTASPALAVRLQRGGLSPALPEQNGAAAGAWR
ncbi:MAG: ATPase, T2SS/T4P/T4SS family [Streptosporangiaceae bacterium]